MHQKLTLTLAYTSHLLDCSCPIDTSAFRTPNKVTCYPDAVHKGDLLSWSKIMKTHRTSGRTGGQMYCLTCRSAFWVFSLSPLHYVPCVLIQPKQQRAVKQIRVPKKLISPGADFQCLEFLFCSHAERRKQIYLKSKAVKSRPSYGNVHMPLGDKSKSFFCITSKNDSISH